MLQDCRKTTLIRLQNYFLGNYDYESKGIAWENFDYYQRLGMSNIQRTWVIYSGCKSPIEWLFCILALAKYNHTLSFYVTTKFKTCIRLGLWTPQDIQMLVMNHPVRVYWKKRNNIFVGDPQNFLSSSNVN